LTGIAAVILWLRRKNKRNRGGAALIADEKKQRRESMTSSKLDEIHVDWDYIENQYNNRNSKLDGYYQPAAAASLTPSDNRPNTYFNCDLNIPSGSNNECNLLTPLSIDEDTTLIGSNRNAESPPVPTTANTNSAVKPDYGIVKPDQGMIDPDSD
jgi:hypothetical protein